MMIISMNSFKLIFCILLFLVENIQCKHLRNLHTAIHLTQTNHHQTSIYNSGITQDLFSSSNPLNEKNQRDVFTTHKNVESKNQFSSIINSGLELINKTNNELTDQLSESGQQLKTLLQTLPVIPTKYSTYAYSQNKREALSLLVQYNVEFDL